MSKNIGQKESNTGGRKDTIGEEPWVMVAKPAPLAGVTCEDSVVLCLRRR